MLNPLLREQLQIECGKYHVFVGGSLFLTLHMTTTFPWMVVMGNAVLHTDDHFLCATGTFLNIAKMKSSFMQYGMGYGDFEQILKVADELDVVAIANRTSINGIVFYTGTKLHQAIIKVGKEKQ